MKPFPLFLLTFVLSSSISSAQDKPLDTLYYKDGRIEVGSFKFGWGSVDRITFKASDSQKRREIPYVQLEKVIDYPHRIRDKRTRVFWPQKAVSRKRVVEKALELGVDGKIQLFFQEVMSAGVRTGGGSVGGGLSKTYYIKKAPTEFAYELVFTSKFRKNFLSWSKETFPNCPELISKIETGIWNHRNMEDIVSFYNTECP